MEVEDESSLACLWDNIDDINTDADTDDADDDIMMPPSTEEEKEDEDTKLVVVPKRAVARALAASRELDLASMLLMLTLWAGEETDVKQGRYNMVVDDRIEARSKGHWVSWSHHVLWFARVYLIFSTTSRHIAAFADSSP